MENIFVLLKNLVISKGNIIGISGMDTSGKTTFAAGFADYMRSLGYKVQLIHIDDFHNPKAIRRASDNLVDAYWHKAFNYQLLIDEILEPLKNGKRVNKTLSLLNLQTDQYDLEVKFEIDSETIVIIEGILLFRPTLNHFFNSRIFIDVDFNVVLERAKKRDVPILGEEILESYRTKYFPNYQRYLKEFDPMNISDIVIDNNDYNKPEILKKPLTTTSK